MRKQTNEQTGYILFARNGRSLKESFQTLIPNWNYSTPLWEFDMPNPYDSLTLHLTLSYVRPEVYMRAPCFFVLFICLCFGFGER